MKHIQIIEKKKFRRQDNFNNVVYMNIPGGIDKGPKYDGRNNSYWSNFKTYLDNGKITYEKLDDALERILPHICKLDDSFQK